jgi:hypothetical protein
MLSSDKEIVRHDSGHVHDGGKSHRESNREGHTLCKDSILPSPDIFVELG